MVRALKEVAVGLRDLALKVRSGAVT